MTNFATVFKITFFNKRQFVQRLALVQFIGAILIAIWWMIGEGNPTADWQISGLLMFLTLMPFVDIFFLFVSSYRNEKLLHTKTWNLIPISTGKLYFANLLSTIGEGIYLILLQIVMSFVLMIPVTTISGFWSSMQKQFGSIAERNLWQYIKLEDVIKISILLLASVIFFYALISLINISSIVLSDFVSRKYNKIIKFVIEVTLLVIAIVLLVRVSNFLFSIIEETLQLGMFQHVLGSNKIYVEPNMWVTIVITIILDIMMLVINIYLLKHFYEAK
ncbi:hypothetical protein [Lactobacillus sp.]|uniref:hypothetical protein n=1 Tax=Lactobacillus sp. TaxID=1591 RepID=UPI0019B879F9|nr:hypothetical protein [Lactobacillus sp.]MBD5429359.1 hypothetical protein [Lactobacillus sp.]